MNKSIKKNMNKGNIENEVPQIHQKILMKQKNIGSYTKNQHLNNQPSPQSNLKLLKLLTSQHNLVSCYSPSLNIYALPSLQNYFTWKVLIFIRNGYYQQGKFKIQIKFNQNIQLDKAFLQIQHAKLFQTNKNTQSSIYLYHPLINSKTGEIDWKKLYKHYSIKKYEQEIFTTMINQEEGLFPLFKGLSCMFSEKHLLQCTDSFHPSAGRMFKTRKERFIQKVYESMLMIQQEEIQNDQQLKDFLLGEQPLLYEDCQESELENQSLSKIKEELDKLIASTELNKDQKIYNLSQYLISGYNTI